MSNRVLFDNGRVLVSERLFKGKRKSYRISNIEQIEVQRSSFWMVLPVSIACFFALQEFSVYLKTWEKVVCVAMVSIVPLTAFFVGSLCVTSKSYTKDNAVIGFTPTLNGIRNALDIAIDEAQNPSEKPDDIEEDDYE